MARPHHVSFTRIFDTHAPTGLGRDDEQRRFAGGSPPSEDSTAGGSGAMAQKDMSDEPRESETSFAKSIKLGCLCGLTG
eukprot:scaffold176393_cov31-Tisochrysis_lutea.AAC.2